MTNVTPAPLARPLYEVAQEIVRDHRVQGKTLNFGAVPYVDAMRSLDSLNDRFYEDDGASVVAYAVSNLGTWRGETAKRVKAELKAALADYRKNRGRR